MPYCWAAKSMRKERGAMMRAVLWEMPIFLFLYVGVDLKFEDEGRKVMKIDEMRNWRGKWWVFLSFSFYIYTDRTG